MHELNALSVDWDILQSEGTRFLRAMTVQESMQQWLKLQLAFEWQLQQTKQYFETERRTALRELQARLQRF